MNRDDYMADKIQRMNSDRSYGEQWRPADVCEDYGLLGCSDRYSRGCAATMWSVENKLHHLVQFVGILSCPYSSYQSGSNVCSGP